MSRETKYTERHCVINDHKYKIFDGASLSIIASPESIKGIFKDVKKRGVRKQSGARCA